MRPSARPSLGFRRLCSAFDVADGTNDKEWTGDTADWNVGKGRIGSAKSKVAE